MNVALPPTLNAIAICAGVGGLELGLRLAHQHRGQDVRGVLYVEREAGAAASLVASMEAGWLHPAPVWSDAGTFDGRRFRGCVDIVTSGDPCFVAGTLVLTRDGYQPIEQLSVGDIVLTHRGRWRAITCTMRRDGADLRQLKAPGVPGVVTTDNHPFYARTRSRVWDNDRRRYVRQFGSPEWIDAGAIGNSTHYLSQVLPAERRSDVSCEILWVIGRWLADGWRQQRKSRGRGVVDRKRRGKVIICCGKHEIDDMRAGLARAGITWWEDAQRTSVRFNIADRQLWDMLDGFGHGAGGKTIPGWALELPRNHAAALLDGYISGDGSRHNVEWRITTVSKSLALGAALLAQRAYGVVATVQRSAVPRRKTIEGRTVNQRDFYVVGIPDANRSSFLDGEYGWKLCRASEPAGVGTVYNISVDEDESYVADGAVVHNCQGNSVAGKRLGELDERWLLDRAIDIFDQSGAPTFFRENVPGNADGQLAVAIPALERLGCRIAVGIFSSAETGNTMRRERLFILAKRAHVGHERRGSARRRRDGPADGGRDLARMLGSGQSELEELDGGTVGQWTTAFDRRHALRRGSEMVQPESIGPREGGTEHAGQQGRRAAPCAGDELGRPDSLHDEGQRGGGRARGRKAAQRPDGLSGRAILPPAVIPGPSDNRGWIDLLDRYPEYQPALSEEEAQSHLRRGIDAMADRIERLRACGNGVDPVTAAYAYLRLQGLLEQ